jgi:cell division protease FtsH
MGVLLCGPPGTGKTLMARCLAGEAGVPFFACAGTEFMEMFVGVGAARIRNLFNQARKCRPCIIFIDEFDSVAVRRKDAAAMEGNDEQVATINQLLTEMDGFGGNSGVMVFAATNRPHVIDPALIRPGRFDRVIEMPLPNRAARMDIIDLHCSYATYEGTIDPDLDVQTIARQCAGFTGADLENLVRTASLRNAARLKAEAIPAGDSVFLSVVDEIRRSNVFKSTGQGNVGETDDTTENALIQQMNPYIRDTICTYYAAQTLVAMMVPGFDEVAKVRVFAAGEEAGQVVYVPDEVGQSGASNVKRKAWYEAKIAVLVAGQMAERYLYGPDKVSQFGSIDMREATALACEMVMLHGWSEIGPLCVLRADSNEEKYLKGGVNKGNNTQDMDSGRVKGKLWGIPPGKDGTLAEGRKAKFKEEPGLELQMELSDELDMLIANEVRKIFIRACQRSVMIMHNSKGTEMLFTLREALATAKELNGPNLRAVFQKFGLQKEPNFDLWDLDWGKTDELYWDEFTDYIWSDDASNTTFWKLVSDQWKRTVADPTASVTKGDGSVEPEIPEWAKEYVRSLPPGGQEEMLMYAPKEVQDRIRAGRPKLYDGPGFGARDIREARSEKDATIPTKPE